MVVIVNAQFTVDKIGLLHKISSLRLKQRAGQGLYRACTDVGKKTASLQKGAFCTSHPVDMQRLVHSRACIRHAFCLEPLAQGCRNPFWAARQRQPDPSTAGKNGSSVSAANVRKSFTAKPANGRAFAAHAFFANACMPFFFERPDRDPGLQPTRPHFLFCQTGFF